MWKLKHRFLSAPPPLDRTARLPILLSGLLLAGIAVQLWTMDEPALPESGPIGGRPAPRPLGAELPPASGGSVVLARAMFAPATAPVAGGAAAPPVLTLVGAVRDGGRHYVVMRGPGDRISSLRVGGRAGGWRLLAIGANDAVLARDKQRIIVPFGAGGTLPPSVAATGREG